MAGAGPLDRTKNKTERLQLLTDITERESEREERNVTVRIGSDDFLYNALIQGERRRGIEND